MSQNLRFSGNMSYFLLISQNLAGWMERWDYLACPIITIPVGEAHVREKGLESIVIDPALAPLCRRV